MLLGDLEQRVMQAAWASRKPFTARELHRRVVAAHDVAYITCVTVANRLVEKRFLHREKRNELFHYEAMFSKTEFLERASRHVVTRILGLGSRAVATSLVDVLAERNPEQLAELAALVRRKLKDRGNDPTP